MVWPVLITVRVLDPMLKAVTQSLVDASASLVSEVSVFFVCLAFLFSCSVSCYRISLLMLFNLWMYFIDKASVFHFILQSKYIRFLPIYEAN